MFKSVAELMTQSPAVVTDEVPFKQVAELFAGNSFSALPVVDDDGRPIGVVTKSDLLFKGGHPDADAEHHLFEGKARRGELRKAAALLVRDLMSSPALTIRGTDSVTIAALRMTEQRVNQLPVVDGEGRLVGIITRGDVLKTYLRSDSEIEDEVRLEVLGHIVPAPREAVTVSVSGGVVKLVGVVEMLSDLETIVAVTRRLSGVVSLDAQLGYRTDDVNPEQIAPGRPLMMR